MGTIPRPLAVVTGASTGIGRELAKLCAEKGFNLVIAADEPAIQSTAAEIHDRGRVRVEPVVADLATSDGIDALEREIGGRPVAALLANAGRGLGEAFLDQSFDDIRRVVDTNVTGTLALIHRVGRAMRERRSGRILITGSIAGFMPGTYQAVYNGTKALLDSFSVALRHELKDSGVTVTCLMPGPTETEFFVRAGLMDTKVGIEKKQAASEVAKIGFDAMMRGDTGVVAGLKNRLQAALAHVLPADMLAEMHGKEAGPGTANKA